MNRALEFRQKLLGSEGCSFRAEVTADYGQTMYSFAMDCLGNSQGDLKFSVAEPETIAGISGTVSDSGGTLTFDDTALHFDLIAEEQLSPVSAGWIFLKALRSGCITSVCMEEELLRISVDDSYEDDALGLDIWLDGDNHPLKADILYDGKRILSLSIRNFTLL